MLESRPPTPTTALGPGQGRFISLRTKFGVFLSLIIIVTCSTLSWYFIQNKREAMTQRLMDIGTILVKNLAYNPRVRFAIVTDDQHTLSEFLDGVMAVDDVVYVIISGPDGEPLIKRSKGVLLAGGKGQRSDQAPLYPDPDILTDRRPMPGGAPLVTYLAGEAGRTYAVPVRTGTMPLLFETQQEERLYDFALPVVRSSEREGLSGSPQLEHSDTERLGTANKSAASRTLGLIQVGLTESYVNRALIDTIRASAMLTLVIILAGIVGAVLLTNRIITPLRSLAHVARRVTSGDLTASAQPTTNDEVGQLTWLLNDMTQSLTERDAAISSNLTTISNQVRQLTTLNQASTAISSTLDLDKLLGIVMQLLSDNLGFVRVIVMFFDPDRGIAYTGRVSGVPDSVAQAVYRLAFPVRDDASLHAELLLRGKPLLVTDLESIAHRLPAANLALLRQVGMTSFVAAPLRSTHRIIGYVGADKGAVACTQEDLDVLTTMASHVAIAIDNARAYQELGLLTTTLEQRVQDRTQELQSANVRLQELDRLKSAFVSIVSHELRTPMTAIRGYIDNMLDGLAGPLTEKQEHYLNRVKVNADRLTHMIAELLDLSRIEAGRVELVLSEVDMRGLILDVVDEFQRLAADKGVRINVQATGSVHAVVGDRNKLHQVLTNLIGNAMKFTPSGGRIDVTLDTTPEGTMRVTVSDSGSGIPPDELPRIFEKFFRGSGVPPEARGAGLGLAIVKTLIELHGGRVWVESMVGQGSRFRFCVPTEPPPPTPPPPP